jgi:hypothetical protein
MVEQCRGLGYNRAGGQYFREGQTSQFRTNVPLHFIDSLDLFRNFSVQPTKKSYSFGARMGIPKTEFCLNPLIGFMDKPIHGLEGINHIATLGRAFYFLPLNFLNFGIQNLRDTHREFLSILFISYPWIKAFSSGRLSDSPYLSEKG